MALFRTEVGTLTYMNPLSGPQPVNGEGAFFGRCADLVNVVGSRQRGREVVDGPDFLTREEAQCLYHSSHIDELPLLRATVLEPVVLPKADGTFYLSKAGYNPEAGVFYFLPAPKQPIEPSESLEHLTTLLSGLPFEAPAYRNNVLAYLLGAVCMDPLMDPPFLSITANQRGVGKSSLAQAIGYVLTGSIPSPIDSTRGEEMSKQIGTKFAEGNRLIFLDNISTDAGRAFHSDKLAALLTSGYSKTVRQLGYSRSIGQSGVLFVATFNDARMDSDLATRALAVKLYADVSRPQTPYVRDYATKHRRAIYAELLGLALRGPTFEPTDAYPHFRFRRWLSFVMPRITRHFGDLAISTVSILEDLSQELFSWGSDNIGKEFTAADFLREVTHTSGGGLPKWPSLHDRFLNILSERGRLASVSCFLKAHTGESVMLQPDQGALLERTKEATHTAGAVYCFKEVQNDTSK